MKKFGFKSIIATVGGILAAVLFTVHVTAMAPTLTLVNNGYNSYQATVYGDPNYPVILDYFANGQIMGAGIVGYTNYSGYFSGQLNPANYAIPSGSTAVVVVDGQQSNGVVWQGNGYTTYPTYPTYPYNTGGYTTSTPVLSQTTASLTVGQSQTIYINGNSYGTNQYYVSNTTNGIVSATISGNALTLYGQSQGSATVTVCSNSTGVYYGGNNCASLYVTVTGAYYNQYPYNNYPPTNYYNNGTISVSNSNVQLTAGSSTTVTLYSNNNGYYGSNNFYVSGYTNNGVTATVVNNTLTIYGSTPGTYNLTVCQTGSSACATITVTVAAQNYYYNNNNNNYYNNNSQYRYYNGQYQYWSSANNCYEPYY